MAKFTKKTAMIQGKKKPGKGNGRGVMAKKFEELERLKELEKKKKS